MLQFIIGTPYVHTHMHTYTHAAPSLSLSLGHEILLELIQPHAGNQPTCAQVPARKVGEAGQGWAWLGYASVGQSSTTHITQTGISRCSDDTHQTVTACNTLFKKDSRRKNGSVIISVKRTEALQNQTHKKTVQYSPRSHCLNPINQKQRSQLNNTPAPRCMRLMNFVPLGLRTQWLRMACLPFSAASLQLVG